MSCNRPVASTWRSLLPARCWHLGLRPCFCWRERRSGRARARPYWRSALRKGAEILFFHPPKDLSTSVFARLPEEFRKADPNNEWARYQPKGSPARSLLEGPSFDRNGNLWCVDLPNGRIYKITSGGEFHVAAEYDGWPNGLKFHKDGRIFIADYKN